MSRLTLLRLLLEVHGGSEFKLESLAYVLLWCMSVTNHL